MKKFLTFITCMVCIITTSCSNKSEQDIEKEISSGVVLVQNQSYYEVDLSNGEKFYFSSYDEQDGIKGFATDEIVPIGLQVKMNFAYFLRLLPLFEVVAFFAYWRFLITHCNINAKSSLRGECYEKRKISYIFK